MDRVGEVDRRRAARQRDQAPLRREAEDLIVEQLELGVLEEFLRVAFGEIGDRAAQPGESAAFRRETALVRREPVLVERMGRDAELGDLVHLLGADLQFDALARRPDHGRVQRAVIVLLRHGDVVLEAARHHRPARMHDAERAVAFRRCP